jgi:DNA polymerase-3 subunit epsilon
METPKKITEGMLLVLDVETTGTDPLSDSIVELGGAYVRGAQLYGDTLRSRVNPQRYISAEASRIHGITNEDVEKSPPWKTVSKWLQRHIERPAGEAPPLVCGYNILHFDLPIINDENRRAELEWRLDPARVLDTYLFCRWFHPEHQSKLGSMCKVYGVGLPEDRAHSADADSAATALLTIAMIWAGYIPDDLEEALRLQAEIKEKMEADVERYGRGF